MTEKKQLARHLYLTTYKTQRQIAEECGVSERTVYNWIHESAWHKLKVASYTAPATICDNLCSQLVELQDHIATREPGKRFPTSQEAEITRKMVLSIATMKKTPSLSMAMQVIESFKDFARPCNKQFSRQLSHYAGRFLSKQSKNGFVPFQMEYGIDPLAAVSPFYDELDGEEPCDTANPPEYPRECKVKGECKLTTGCSWPKCEKELPTIKFDDPIDQQIIPEPWSLFDECHGERSRTTTLPLSSSGSPWWDQTTPDVDNSTETPTSKDYDPLPTTMQQPEKTGNSPEIPEVDRTSPLSALSLPLSPSGAGNFREIPEDPSALPLHIPSIDCHGERSRTTTIPLSALPHPLSPSGRSRSTTITDATDSCAESEPIIEQSTPPFTLEDCERYQSTPDVEKSPETLTGKEPEPLPTTPPQPEKTGNSPEIPDPPVASNPDCHGERSRTTTIPPEPKKYKDPDYPFDPIDPTPWLPKKPGQTNGRAA